MTESLQGAVQHTSAQETGETTSDITLLPGIRVLRADSTNDYEGKTTVTGPKDGTIPLLPSNPPGYPIVLLQARRDPGEQRGFAFVAHIQEDPELTMEGLLKVLKLEGLGPIHVFVNKDPKAAHHTEIADPPNPVPLSGDAAFDLYELQKDKPLEKLGVVYHKTWIWLVVNPDQDTIVSIYYPQGSKIDFTDYTFHFASMI